jgi:putative ABC transport system substrate-binding protein
MKRRAFILSLGGVAASWLLAARAQERPRRVGVLMGIANDSEGNARTAAFRRRLQEFGWEEGRNIHFDYRWGPGDISGDARELIALMPDVILANSTLAATMMKRTASSVPIVFVQVADPVREGIVDSLARPGGYITGFTSFEYAMGGKWLEILKEIAPGVSRVAVVHSPLDPNWPGFKAAIEDVATKLNMLLTLVDVREPAGLEAAIETFAREPNGGVIAPPTPAGNQNRKLIIALAAKNRLPTVFPFRFFVADGGLVSYGIDSVDPFRLAAAYVNRILKGEKPSDLPVQAPTKYEMVVNLKTAKAIGLSIPESFLLRADGVIE